LGDVFIFPRNSGLFGYTLRLCSDLVKIVQPWVNLVQVNRTAFDTAVLPALIAFVEWFKLGWHRQAALQLARAADMLHHGYYQRR